LNAALILVAARFCSDNWLMDDRESALRVARRLIAQRLESLQRCGVEQLGKLPVAPLFADTAGSRAKPGQDPHPSDASPSLSSMPRAKTAPLSPAVSVVSGQDSLIQPDSTKLAAGDGNREELLNAVNAEVRACTLCRDLACTRKQTVFGVGNAHARVVFFGEAPGADEDRLGEPFVGRAGQLLTKIIEACGWQRSDVYIMNVLKCRPPDNRNPLPHEVDNCRPFFQRQLEILRPEYIVCAGTVPAQALLQTAEPVGRLRGRFHRYKDSTVLVTYHPSYLLRNPSAKKYVWDDMQMLLKEMGLPVPKRGAG
jgi:DNA polymerase